MQRNLPIVWRFLAIGSLWGSGFVWAGIALQSTSWEFMTWVRGFIGVGTLGLLVLIAKLRDPKQQVLPRSWKTWWHFGVVGVLLAAIPNAMWSVGQLGVSASMASIYNSAVPIFTAIFAGLVFRVDRLSGRNWLGIVVGLSGVVIVIAPWSSVAIAGNLPNQIACLVAVLSVASAFAYQRKFLGETKVSATTAAFLIAVGGAAVSLAATPWWAARWFSGLESPTPMAWFSMIVLGAFIGGFAYVWNIRVVEAWGATGASMVAYVTPLVGVSLGVLLLGDSLGWNAPLGGAVVIAGIAIAQSGALNSEPTTNASVEQTPKIDQ